MRGLAMLVLLWLTPWAAVAADEPGLQRYLIGDFTLESGEVIHDFSIAYMTEGTLNAAKSNAVLMVTAIGGNHGRPVTIPSVQGHVAASPGFKMADVEFINATVRAFLADVTEGWRRVE